MSTVMSMNEATSMGAAASVSAARGMSTATDTSTVTSVDAVPPAAGATSGQAVGSRTGEGRAAASQAVDNRTGKGQATSGQAAVNRAGSDVPLASLDHRVENARKGVPTGLDAVFAIMFEVAGAPLSKIYGGRAACASRALSAVRVPFDEGMRMPYGEFCQRAFELHDKEPKRYRTVAREICKRFRRELELREARRQLLEGYDVKTPRNNRLMFLWGSILSSDYLEASCLIMNGSPTDEVLRAIERSEAGCPKDIATLCAEPRSEFTMDELSHMTVTVDDDASQDDILQEAARVLWEHGAEGQSAESEAPRSADEASRFDEVGDEKDEDILAEALLIEPFAAIYRADQMDADQTPFIDWDEEIL